MDLRDLGLDRWFADKALDQCGSGPAVARVVAVDRGRFVIRDEQGERPAELTGRLQFVAESSVDLPCVGDWVCVRYRDARSDASIQGVLPRKSFLRRKAPGRDIDFQMIAANIDVAFVLVVHRGIRQVLQEGDRLSSTPTKIEGGRTIATN